MLQSHEQSSIRPLCVSFLEHQVCSLHVLCVGHLTFILREYQDNLLVGTALHCALGQR